MLNVDFYKCLVIKNSHLCCYNFYNNIEKYVLNNIKYRSFSGQIILFFENIFAKKKKILNLKFNFHKNMKNLR